MTVPPDFEAPRAAPTDGFSDAVTLAFGDPAARLYGSVRLGLGGGMHASGLLVLFHDDELATIAAEGGVEAADPSRWEGVQAAGIDVETVEPLRSWRVSFAGEDASLDLEVEAVGTAFAPPPDDPVARLGGMHGYEQPVVVRGRADVRGTRVTVEALGQRGRSWGEPDWSSIARTRTVSAWFPRRALTIAAIAKGSDAGHGAESVSATIFDPDEDATLQGTAVADARVSTTFDADGRQRHTGLELWSDEDGPPLRIGGDVLCGTTLDLGRLRLDTAFMHWRGPDGDGLGRYDMLRRLDA